MRLHALLLAPFVLILGCKSPGGDAPAPAETAQATTPINNGASTSSPAPAAPAAAGHSPVPTTAEWSQVGEVTVHNSGSLGCETKMIREWLRVSCKGPDKDNAATGVTVVRPTGDKEFFTFTSQNLASLVMPVRSRVDAEARFTWAKWGARTLRVTWPNGAPNASMSFDRGADPK